MSYQRARSPEHKEQRREAILAAARELASERSVREVSLGAIGRRVELAKSNLLRYFESREDIFLALLEREWAEWDDAATEQMTADAGDVLARTLGERPLFCDLVTEMASVLERNVSAERVRGFKSGSLERVDALAAVVERHTGLTPVRRPRGGRRRARADRRRLPALEPRPARRRDARRGARAGPRARRLRGPPAARAARPDRGLQPAPISISGCLSGGGASCSSRGRLTSV